jgi:hypothetical protein
MYMYGTPGSPFCSLITTGDSGRDDGLEGRVTGRLIVDLGGDGSVTVSTVAEDGELPSSVRGEALSWPLDDKAVEDLRWYLEDYLVAPFGVYEDQGEHIEASVRTWGERVLVGVRGRAGARCLPGYAGAR